MTLQTPYLCGAEGRRCKGVPVGSEHAKREVAKACGKYKNKKDQFTNPMTDLAIEKNMQIVTTYFIKMLHGTRESSAVEEGIFFFLLAILSKCPWYSFVKDCQLLVPVEDSSNSSGSSLVCW